MRTQFITLLAFLVLSIPANAARQAISLPGMHAPGSIVRDVEGVPHIFAVNEHDMAMLQGWIHANDRLFQMDVVRRSASGRLAELLGPEALASDVELRTIGLSRAAKRSLAALSDEVLAALEAYAAGVNAWVASNPLPPEYGVLELSTFEPWTSLDSVAVGKSIAFFLSFRLDIENTIKFLSYQGAGALLGFDGVALYQEDLERVEPLAPLATMPDATDGITPYIPIPLAGLTPGAAPAASARSLVSPTAGDVKREKLMALAERYRNRVKKLPLFERFLKNEKVPGSNEWAIAGKHSKNGRPLIANDPHLTLAQPTTLYHNHLVTADGFNVIGYSIPGAPYVLLGQNKFISWGGTANQVDVTDVYQEAVVPDETSPSGLSTVYMGEQEPVIPIPEAFVFNIIGDGENDSTAQADGPGIPAATLIVPRRNQGPIVQLDLDSGGALSVQYAGFSATREIDALRLFNRARNVSEFKEALQFFDFGSLNFAYADIRGNIAYFASGEIPVREDLQNETVYGLPPFFIRDGTGGNEWVQVDNPPPGQALAYEVLPQDELPGFVNPVQGYFVNTNNDPAGVTLDNNPLNQLRLGGKGLYYIGAGFRTGSRAYRVTERIEERLSRRPMSTKEMQRIQADVKLHDAELLVPYILTAFKNASDENALSELQELRAERRLVEAVRRLRDWEFSSPTGVSEGYDATNEKPWRHRGPTEKEISESIAVTIYSVWRSRFIHNTIDTTLAVRGLGGQLPSDDGSIKALNRLLENFADTQGVGASGLDFFVVPGVVDAEDRRDIILLRSLQEALGKLAGPEFADAFDGSPDQNDYRWGRLHRIVIASPLGEPFSMPPAGGEVPASFPDLPGYAVDGAYNVVDQSAISARAEDADSFMFDLGPVFRYVGELGRSRGTIRGVTSLPGGESGVLGSPFYANLLEEWLTNDTYPVRQSIPSIIGGLYDRTFFRP